MRLVAAVQDIRRSNSPIMKESQICILKKKVVSNEFYKPVLFA